MASEKTFPGPYNLLLQNFAPYENLDASGYSKVRHRNVLDRIEDREIGAVVDPLATTSEFRDTWEVEWGQGRLMYYK